MRTGKFSVGTIKRQRGTALVSTMLTAVVLGGAMATALSVTGRRTALQKNQSDSHKAFTAAESGVDQAIALANDGQFDSLAPSTSQSLSPTTTVGATSNIVIFRLADVVNANTTMKTLRIESTGAFGQTQKNVVGFIRQVLTTIPLDETLPTVESAVTLNDPFAQLKISGMSFLINGNDKEINGAAPSTPNNLWGTGIGPQSDGTPGDPQLIKDQMSNNQQTLVQGQGGAPSVGSVSAVPIDTVIAALAPAADVTLVNYEGTYTGDLGNYNQGTPQLTYCVGDIHISGGSTGYGVLLVDGNLTISGNWNYVGMIFVNGQVTFSGGGNTKKLTGAIFIDGDVRDIEVNGNITLQYSSEAVALIDDYLETKTTTTASTWAFVSSAETGP